MRINWRTSKFDYYIFSELITHFIGAITFIIFILLMFQTLRLAEFLILHFVSGTILLKLAFFMIVSLLPMAVPLAFLMSVLLTFSRLSLDSELIAMKSSGVSLLRLSCPVAFFAVITVGVCLSLNQIWVPWSESSFKKMESKVQSTKVASIISEGAFNSGFFDLLIFADKVDTKTNRLQHVFIRDEREPKNELTYVAQEAEIVPVKTNSEYSSAILLQLYRGSSHHQDLEHHLYERTDFEAYHLYLRINEGSGDASMRPRMIPQKQLETFVKDNPPTTHVGREFRGEYWRRYSTAITPLIFLFLGIGFGTSHHRSAKMGAVLIGLLLSVLYWALQTIDFFLLDHHILNPFWALQLPNIILLIIGLWRYRYALK